MKLMFLVHILTLLGVAYLVYISRGKQEKNKLEPFDARVVVKKPHREEQTASGIFLPDTASEQGQTALGEVLAVGQGSRNMNTGEYMPIPIKKGDTIIYTKFSATEVQHDGEEYFFVAERDIVAVVEKA